MTTSRTTRLLLAGTMALTMATVAEAQLGGLIKKKVSEAVKGPEKTEAKPADAGRKSFFNDDVLEITQPVLDGFERGLRTEVALRDEFREFLAKLKTPAQYQACKNDVSASPEGQKIATRMLSLPESTPPEELQRVILKAGQELEALQTKKCGTDPAEWTEEKRAEKLREFEVKAAEAAGPEAPPGKDLEPAGPEGISEPSDDAEVLSAPLAQYRVTAGGLTSLAMFGLTERAYAMLKERTIAFCMHAAIATRNTYESKVDLSVVQVPGQGDKVYFVYTSEEARTLQRNCAKLMGFMKKLANVAWEEATKK
jgi:hypothetical protein